MKHLQKKIILTGDGSHTIQVPELNENYHSTYGAVQESEHVFISSGLDFIVSKGRREVRILEIGFGTGLNALLTFLKAGENGIKVMYTGLELYPVPGHLTAQLNYPIFIKDPNTSMLFREITGAPWNAEREISDNLKFIKQESDIISVDLDNNYYDLVYFDAFGPDVQPDLWELPVLKKCSDSLLSGGVFVTYSCKGYVRRNLKEAGLRVEKIPGPEGKREMLRGHKD